MNNAAIERRLLDTADALAPEIFDISRFIHANPEPGFEETKSANYLVSMLAGHGFRVDRPVKGMPTAFRAVKKGSRKGPAVGFVCEYDALPEIGHGCGHNLIAASGFGAAVALAAALDKTGGSVWLFGTPAEETGGSKALMARDGFFDGLDAVIMTHPESMYMVNTSGLALDALEFEFLGKSTHAAATPWEGVNALDALILFFNSVGALRQQLKPDARVHGIITKGGTAPNIIPHLTEARFYIRAAHRGYLDEVARKVRNCALGAAKAAGCRLRVKKYEPSLDNVINNPVLAGLVESKLRALGVSDIVPGDEVPGSTDFGNLSRRVPSLYFYCATAPKGADLHTREFTEFSVKKLAHDNILIAVKAMAAAGLEILSNPALASQARAELSRALKMERCA